ncbi:recombinase family protein [Halobellus inordinatus]|uniref:recombinase family protein n=1 Tax=Halobellus inordinatus TaxID=1126236 RepID=UPI0021086C1D
MSQTAIYARVSTEEQSLEGQQKSAWEYATETLGIEPASIEIIRDKSTGTNTDRSGYRDLLDRAADDEFERVIVREVSRIARNMRDLNETIGQLVDDHDVTVHIIDAGLVIGEGDDDGVFDDRLVLQFLGIAAELEAKMTKQRTIAGLAAAQAAGKHTGRPPYGFDTDSEGYLIPNENFYTALAVIERIEAGESVRSTARHADIARSTVRNIVDRKDVYLKEDPSLSTDD